jgi:hypothetical protein
VRHTGEKKQKQKRIPATAEPAGFVAVALHVQIRSTRDLGHAPRQLATPRSLPGNKSRGPQAAFGTAGRVNIEEKQRLPLPLKPIRRRCQSMPAENQSAPGKPR